MHGNPRKARLVASRGTGRPKLNYAARVSWIASQRESRLSEIKSLRGGLAEAFVDKAQTLLTREWSKATWRSRERLLHTVDWLLHMELARRNMLAERQSNLKSKASRRDHA